MAFNELPPEILLGIFSRLSYRDLKCSISRVSKRFRLVIGASSSDPSVGPAVDRILFKHRAPLSDSAQVNVADSPWFEDSRIFYPRNYRWLQEDDAYSFHPVFEKLHYACTLSLSDIKIVPGPLRERLSIDNDATAQLQSLVDNPVANENATSPAVSALVLGLRRFTPIVVRCSNDRNAVTVQDVMAAVLEILGTRITTKHAVFCLPSIRVPMSSLQPMAFWESWNPKAAEAMSQICGWWGFSRLLVIDGSVHLIAELPVIRFWRRASSVWIPPSGGSDMFFVREPYGSNEEIPFE